MRRARQSGRANSPPARWTSREDPNGPRRCERDIAVNEGDVRLLATVWAFRVSTNPTVHRGSGDVAEPANDRHLVRHDLLSREILTDVDGVRRVLALADDSRAVREALPAERQAPRLAFYAGVVSRANWPTIHSYIAFSKAERMPAKPLRRHG
jgi:hypothetical protein